MLPCERIFLILKWPFFSTSRIQSNDEWKLSVADRIESGSPSLLRTAPSFLLLRCAAPPRARQHSWCCELIFWCISRYCIFGCWSEFHKKMARLKAGTRNPADREILFILSWLESGLFSERKKNARTPVGYFHLVIHFPNHRYDS